MGAPDIKFVWYKAARTVARFASAHLVKVLTFPKERGRQIRATPSLFDTNRPLRKPILLQDITVPQYIPTRMLINVDTRLRRTTSLTFIGRETTMFTHVEH